MQVAEAAGTLASPVSPSGVRNWRDSAACRGVDPEVFFPPAERGPQRAAAEEQAKQVCAGCPARAACLVWALKALPYGVAGGLTEQERSALRSVGSRQTRESSEPVVVVPVVYAKRGPSRGELIAAGRRALADGASRDHVAETFGVSRRTVDRWAASSSAPAGSDRVAAEVPAGVRRLGASHDAANGGRRIATTAPPPEQQAGEGSPAATGTPLRISTAHEALAGNTAPEGNRS
ncbi:WhiB family transcriptional regulator [Pseudonocardia dioxanivorans]|uniref:WhiB family transcriptional regulator n=1 Tax=Pseudonocardia dioxanivorans TaxID=240495 RepID=UPI000A02F4EC|nr:WhiB family transcriptional regulator [Pseudonocardia dioxanivorans]